MWAAAAVQAQTGVDLAASLRGRYNSAKTARALIRGEFDGSIENIPAAVGLEEVPLVRCQRGYVVSAAFPRRGVALGVCLGHKAAFAGRKGLVFVPMVDCKRSWRIG